MNGIIQVLKLLKVVDNVKGRKKLQKMVHILQCEGYEFKENFGYLHYGPYSSELAAEIDALKTTPLLDEEPVQGTYETFVYKSTPALAEFLREINESDRPAWADLAIELNQKSTPLLEAISTILYLKKRGFSGDLLLSRFRELKPKLEKFAVDALTFTKDL